MGQDTKPSSKKHTESILSKLVELHQFASRTRKIAYYHPLSELQKYLETTMLGYQDEQNRLQSMRLSEVISLLSIPPSTDMNFKPSLIQSLTHFFLLHFLKESKPGSPLFKKLSKIKKL
jgi:hypothetical protein